MPRPIDTMKTPFNIDKAIFNNASDFADFAKVLESLPKYIDFDKRRAALTKAAGPVVEAAKANAPVADEIGYFYDTPKVSGKLKAPKGMGVVKKKINPGNLRDNIGILTHGRFKKSPNIFVGPKYAKRGRGRGANYAHIVEFGSVRNYERTPFMRPAFENNKEVVFQIAKEEFKKILDTWELKNIGK